MFSKKHSSAFSPFQVFFDCGAHLAKLKQRARALTYFSYAEELVKDQSEMATLLAARIRVHCAMSNTAEARADCEKLAQLDPSSIRSKIRDTEVCIQEGNFEESLIKCYRELRIRKKPDNFSNTIKVVHGIIEGCIGRNAGDFTMKSELGNSFVQLEYEKLGILKPKPKRPRFKQKQLDRIFEQKTIILSEKYLGPLWKDKHFMVKCFNDVALNLGDEDNRLSIETTIVDALQKIDQKEELLWQSKQSQAWERPIKPSYKMVQRQRYEVAMRDSATEKEIQRLLTVAHNEMKKNNWTNSFNKAYNAREIIKNQMKNHLPRKKEYVDACCMFFGEMYLSMKTLLKDCSKVKNRQRILYMFGCPNKNRYSNSMYSDSVHAKVLHVRKYIDDLVMERKVRRKGLLSIFLSNEIALCCPMTSSLTVEHTKHCIVESSRLWNKVWFLNGLFLLARLEVHCQNLTDATAALLAAKQIADERKMKSLADFLEEALNVFYELRTPDILPSIACREAEKMVGYAPDTATKLRAMSLWERAGRLPRSRRLPVCHEPESELRRRKERAVPQSGPARLARHVARRRRKAAEKLARLPLLTFGAQPQPEIPLPTARYLE